MMATTKPRITITLNEADYAVLKRLNSLNGVPMSKTVTELVELVSPVLGRVCDNLEKVKLADENVKKSLLHSVEKSLAAMEEIYAAALDNMDMFSAELGRAVEEEQASRRDARKASAGAAAACVQRGDAAPPSSNTGVRKSKLAGIGG